MDLGAFHSSNDGAGVVLLDDPADGPGGGTVAVTPTSASTGSRGLRIQGMPVRRWLRTTPGRLRAASALLVVGLLVFAIATTSATQARSDAARKVATESTPALLAAQSLYGSLADADAIASTVFLRAGLEPKQLRSRFVHDLEDAGRYLAILSEAAEASPSSRRAIRTISENLPRYSGLVELSRANNLQGNSVGNSYLQDASDLMRDTIQPATTALYRNTAEQLDENYSSGTSSFTLGVVLVAGIAMLILLVAVQVFVRRRSNRILNFGLVGATVLVVGLFGWTLLRFAAGHDALHRAQSRGSDSVEVLSSARILMLRAQNDENLALIARGNGDQYVAEFDRTMEALGGTDGTGGLLGYAAELAERTGDGARVRSLAKHFTELTSLHDQVRKLDDDGKYPDAVYLSVGTSNQNVHARLDPNDEARELQAVDRMQEALQDNIARAQVRLVSAAADARVGFGVLVIAIPLFAILAGLLVLLGLERRIGEYR